MDTSVPVAVNASKLIEHNKLRHIISSKGFTLLNLNSNRRCATKTSNVGLFMVALWNRADHYIFMLWFVLSSSSSSSFFSSPNLSRHRLDVYHTSAHGVVLV